MAVTDEPSARIRKGIAAFTEIAERVEGLEAELRDHERMLGEREGDVEDLSRELDEHEDAEPVLDDLEDLRRGVITPEEMYDKWLERIPASVPWARAASVPWARAA